MSSLTSSVFNQDGNVSLTLTFEYFELPKHNQKKP